MTRTNVALLGALLASQALIAEGCSAFSGGRTIVKLDENADPIMTKVGCSGSYALYALTDMNPKVTLELREGDPIGFRSSATGEVLARAGDREIPLKADENYYWKQR